MPIWLVEKSKDCRRMVSLACSLSFLGFIWLLVFQVLLNHMLPRIVGIIHNIPLANTPPCDAAQCDFSVFWPAGLLARQGHYVDLYNPALFSIFRKSVLFPGELRLDWMYPPPSLLPVILISFLPFGYAFLAWTCTLLTIGIFVLRKAHLSWSVIAISLCSPAALWDIEMGQWEIFCGAVMIAGLLIEERAARRGGVLLSLMILKPQIAFLVPVGLLARRHLTTMGSGALAVLGIVSLTTIILGASAWRAWLMFGIGNTQQTLVADHAVGLGESISVFWMMRNFGAGTEMSYTVQAATSIAAAVVVWAVWRNETPSHAERMALTVFCGLLFTPYAFIVDMVAYEIALVVLIQQRKWRIDILDVVFWLWPMLGPSVYLWTGWLVTPWMIALLVARTWFRAGLRLPFLPGYTSRLTKAPGE